MLIIIKAFKFSSHTLYLTVKQARTIFICILLKQKNYLLKNGLRSDFLIDLKLLLFEFFFMRNYSPKLNQEHKKCIKNHIGI